MPYIHSLSIKHYRGIKDFSHTFGEQRCVVLIGRGDSGKSTILKAISALLSPVWNTTFSDLDFYNRDIDQPIVIEAVVADAPDELIDMAKYGEYSQYLYTGQVLSEIPDDADGCKLVLKIRLTVDSSLEPKWTVVSDRENGEKIISQGDRASLNMFMVSDYVDNHFAYSKGSPLYSHLRKSLAKDQKKAPEQKLVELVREAYKQIKDSNDFAEFSAATQTILNNAQGFGLTLTDLQAILEFKNNVYSESGISLHSDGIPFRLHGKGSKRLLSIAIQSGLIEDGGIVLIDEIEQGLEPDRVRNLTRILARSTKGQVFITTHSRDVVLEPSANQIFLMRQGGNHLLSFDDELQGTLRAKPEAFFAKRIICCEGATEEGIIRAISDDLQERRGYGIAVQGIVHIDGSGSNKFYELAITFKKIGIEPLVFCDDDNRDVDKYKEEAIAQGIAVVLCDNENSIEKQLFNDLPWQAVCELVDYAINEHEGEKQILPLNVLPEVSTIEQLLKIEDKDKKAVREELGKRAASKKGAWFKNIHHGEFLGRKWIQYLQELPEQCTLKKEFKSILDWIGNDIG